MGRGQDGTDEEKAKLNGRVENDPELGRCLPSFRTRVLLIQDILAGLREMHKQGYIHRDLKPENIGIFVHPQTRRLTACIIDFGLAIRFMAAGWERRENDYYNCEKNKTQLEFPVPGDDVWSRL